MKTDLVLDPLLNWQPVQLTTNIGSDVVELPLMQNDSCGGGEHILQRLDMISTCTIDDTVTVVYPPILRYAWTMVLATSSVSDLRTVFICRR